MSTFELAFEEMRAQARHGKSPFGDILQRVVERGRVRQAPGTVAAKNAAVPQPLRSWQTFEDVVALNEALEDPAFLRDWGAVREREGHLVTVTGSLYPYEPICAGSARMWRAYWTEMQQVLIARLGGTPAGGSLGRTEKMRDWLTQSLFLWGFSMTHAPQPNEGRWLGLGSMDEINAMPVAFAPAVWERHGPHLFLGRDRAWDVRLTGHLERRSCAATAPGNLCDIFKTLEREFYLLVRSPDQVTVIAKSVYFSAYIWGLFKTRHGNAYGLWEHANIADPELFEEGVSRLAGKARELCEPGDRLAAALGPEVEAAIGRTAP